MPVPHAARLPPRAVPLVKAHAYGNDFLLLEERELAGSADHAALARAACDRHRGIGADGLILFREDVSRVSMRLINADGSPSEISGNGLRCLASWMALIGDLPADAELSIETEAGSKRLRLLERTSRGFRFRAHMGLPERVERHRLTVAGTDVPAITLRIGNPQCVVLGAVTGERLHTIAAPLSTHPHFPQGTNVELAEVDGPARVRMLIWERGVGPTESSGTGACAAAVAAITQLGLPRDIEVVAPGGAQRVEWQEDGLYLTGWAELIAETRWWGRPDA